MFIKKGFFEIPNGTPDTGKKPSQGRSAVFELLILTGRRLSSYDSESYFLMPWKTNPAVRSSTVPNDQKTIYCDTRNINSQRNVKCFDP